MNEIRCRNFTFTRDNARERKRKLSMQEDLGFNNRPYVITRKRDAHNFRDVSNGACVMRRFYRTHARNRRDFEIEMPTVAKIISISPTREDSRSFFFSFLSAPREVRMEIPV